MVDDVVFHIGYHKTATTWLQEEILPRHPQLARFVAAGPTGNPFLRAVIMEPDRSFDPSAARVLFDARVAEIDAAGRVVVVSNEHLSGHAGTGGYDAFRIAGRLAATVPEAKVFFVVREQVSMIESEYRQLVFEGSPAKLEDLLARPSASMRPGFDLGHYEYDLLADRYVELFGADRVRVFEFSAVVSRPRDFLGELAEFIGIEPWPELPDDVLAHRVNATLPRRLLSTRRALNHLQKSGLNPHPPVALPPFWRTPLWALAMRLPPPRRPLLDDETRQRLRARYAESNERLAARYGIRFPETGRR
ncbi:MAG: sulfotransferase [Acidimicrobiia bacterium]